MCGAYLGKEIEKTEGKEVAPHIQEAKRVKGTFGFAPFFFLLPAPLLWLPLSGSRSCRSGSLSSFQSSPSFALLFALLNDLLKMFVPAAFHAFDVLAA